MTKERYFHFSLGPVQGFVAQARRTRDFWAGSFILSWLSAVAMKAVEKQGGGARIIFPEPDQSFMTALESGESGPKQGNVPNRFKAEVSPNFTPALVEKSVQIAWQALAELVWERDLEGVASPASREIWQRQISTFWDIQWTLVEGKEDSNSLDRLKNWRTYLPPDEAGVKCMMMDGWQELSGAARPGHSKDDPDGPASFWAGIRARGSRGMMTDLREREMLCAVAFVKRRFARHFERLHTKMPGGWSLRGWTLPPGVPSVHYLAAAPWLTKLLQTAAADGEDGTVVRAALADFHDSAYALTGEYGEWDSNIACVRKADGIKQWKALDGAVFFDAMLENRWLWDEKAADARDLQYQLKDLRKAARLDPVSPFYAVLLMDGDELGIQMSDADKAEAITQGLAQFTSKVEGIVDDHNGFLVYAGGDDVLALLPLGDALPCAAALRANYADCFDLKRIPTSLSGAIEFAHVKMPLGKVLQDAHGLLDEVAKESRGRDALACRIWKPGGRTVEWAMPWECALDGQEVVVDKLAAEFRGGMAGKDGDMASGFFYRIRELFDLLNPTASGGSAVLHEDEGLDLLAMEYLNSGLVRDAKVNMDRARDRVRPLLEQCRPVTRDKSETDHSNWPRSKRVESDGAMLVRFLAFMGIDR